MRIGQSPLDDRRNPERDARDVVGPEPVLAPQHQHGVDAGRNPRRCGVALHQHVHDVPALAEPVLDQARIPLARIGARESAATLDDVGRPREAGLRQQRRRHPRLRRMRRLDALGVCPRVVELRDTARIAAGETERLGDAPRRIAAAEQQPSGRRRGAEADACAGRLEAAPEMRRLHAQADPDRGLVAGDHRGDDVAAARPGLLRARQRRRPACDARMQHRAHMRVVRIEARPVGHVEEGGMLRIELVAAEQHLRGTRLRHHAGIMPRPLRPPQPCAKRCHAQKIEQQPAELVAHRLGQGARVELRRKGAK